VLCAENPCPSELLKLKPELPRKYDRVTWKLVDLPQRPGSRRVLLPTEGQPGYRTYVPKPKIKTIAAEVVAEVTQRYPVVNGVNPR